MNHETLGRRARRAYGVALLLGLCSHFLTLNTIPSCLGLLVLAGVSALTVTGALFAALRTRGPWSALFVLGCGQFSTDVLVSSIGHGSHGSPLNFAVLVLHPLAAVVLGVVLLGWGRVREGLTELAEVVAPRWWRPASSLPTIRRAARVAAATSTPKATAVDLRRPLRGPPGGKVLLR